jgi:flavin reductase (DIM6/NTAB) family NADH-FMN oxidoreductase RutF
MNFSSNTISPAMAYKLLVSTILPRPIAFVTSLNLDGRINAAPFSFFNAMGSKPPVVVLGFEPKPDGSQKDTPNNILATSEFVVNIVNEPLAQQMNICAASLPADESEIDLAGLQTLPSIEVAPPRLAASPASFECRLVQDIELSGGGRIILGEVLHFHLSDDVVSTIDPLRIDIDKLAPISRLSGPLYGRISDQFEIQRPK